MQLASEPNPVQGQSVALWGRLPYSSVSGFGPILICPLISRLLRSCRLWSQPILVAAFSKEKILVRMISWTSTLEKLASKTLAAGLSCWMIPLTRNRVGLSTLSALFRMMVLANSLRGAHKVSQMLWDFVTKEVAQEG